MENTKGIDLAILPPERRSTLRLKDGRNLGWSEWGPVTGLPVLFCPGAAMSSYLGFGARDLKELGLRLVAIDRPGLGRSDPDPDKSLMSWARDCGELIERLDLVTPVAVGFSQGAPFAYALAAKSLVAALAVVSGQDDFSHPQTSAQLAPEVSSMITAATGDRANFERRIAEAATADWLQRFVMETSSSRDREVYGDASFEKSYRRALEEGFSQGAAGYARDLTIATGPWPFRLEDIAVPVDLWYGANDSSTVHSPDLGATMASRLPVSWRVLEAAEGGSILWTRSGEILARLLSHVTVGRSGS